MNVTNITDDNMPLCNCTDDDNNMIIEISPILIIILTIVPCGLSFLCLISISIYTLVKNLLNKK